MQMTIRISGGCLVRRRSNIRRHVINGYVCVLTRTSPMGLRHPHLRKAGCQRARYPADSGARREGSRYLRTQFVHLRRKCTFACRRYGRKDYVIYRRGCGTDCTRAAFAGRHYFWLAGQEIVGGCHCPQPCAKLQLPPPISEVTKRSWFLREKRS